MARYPTLPATTSQRLERSVDVEIVQTFFLYATLAALAHDRAGTDLAARRTRSARHAGATVRRRCTHPIVGAADPRANDYPRRRHRSRASARHHGTGLARAQGTARVLSRVRPPIRGHRRRKNP